VLIGRLYFLQKRFIPEIKQTSFPRYGFQMAEREFTLTLGLVLKSFT